MRHFQCMNGPQLIAWRKAHDLTLTEVAALLGDVHHTSISRWERSPEQIPQWATEKLLGRTKITLAIDELQQLLDLSRAENVPAQQLIATAIRDYIGAHAVRQNQPDASTISLNETPATHKTDASP
jgi:hypothetical protein